MTIFSLSHIIYLLICAIIVVAYYFIFKNKSKKVQNIALFIPLVLAFIIHFLKPLIPVYKDNLPQSLQALTPESICAISTLIFPFIYFSKNKALKDYMVVVGTISGFLTLIIPADVLGIDPTNIEVIRFFFAHLTIFMVPLLMYLFDIHKLKGNWVKNTLIIFAIAVLIMILDTLLFTFIYEGKQGLLDMFNLNR